MEKWISLILLVCSLGWVVCEDLLVISPVTGERKSVSRELYDLYYPYVASKPPDPVLYPPALLAELQQDCQRPHLPTVFEFLNKTVIAVEEFCFHPDRYPYDMSIYQRVFSSIRWQTLAGTLLCAVGFTLARYLLSVAYFSTSIGKRFTTERARAKSITSLFTALAYIFLYAIDNVVVAYEGQADLDFPLCMWNNLHMDYGYFDQPFPPYYFYLYVLQMGFYMHSFYSSIFLDCKRKDTTVTIIHHVITVALLLFSLSARFHRIGLVVLYLHDISDILLEVGKWVITIRKTDPRRYAWLEYVANISFFLFVATWVVNRVYLFPKKILYATTWGVYITHVGREAPFFLFFNVMLWTLFLLQLYWSYFITVMLIKILTGKMPSLSDAREFESENDMKVTPEKPSAVAHNGASNGFAVEVRHQKKEKGA